MPGSVILFTTTAFAPIATLSAIVIFPIILHPSPKNTLSPIYGAKFCPFVAPIVTPVCILQFLPTDALLFTMIVP